MWRFWVKFCWGNSLNEFTSGAVRHSFKERGFGPICPIISNEKPATRGEWNAIQTVGVELAPNVWEPLHKAVFYPPVFIFYALNRRYSLNSKLHGSIYTRQGRWYRKRKSHQVRLQCPATGSVNDSILLSFSKLCCSTILLKKLERKISE